jgi:hypothetical protein
MQQCVAPTTRAIPLHLLPLSVGLPRLPTLLERNRIGSSDRKDPFAAVIRCTADPAKADKRTLSKWSRIMRYAAAYKPDSEPLDRFISA